MAQASRRSQAGKAEAKRDKGEAQAKTLTKASQNPPKANQVAAAREEAGRTGRRMVHGETHEEANQFMVRLGESVKPDSEHFSIVEWEQTIAPGPTARTGSDLTADQTGDYGSYDPDYMPATSVNEPEVQQVQEIRGEGEEPEAEARGER